MATISNISKNTATLTDLSKYVATLSNQAISSIFGNYTMAQLAGYTLAQLANYTFNSAFVPMTNETKH